ncbi:PGPGW domain-containing protein [Oceanobacter mangrovi]|uniref:PGPGW domain-containing protein n=1 Tax=Oceanobacter mangrovi TaxID=2862510 RepID=UPI001C8DEB92|nr:PGPGW domain-containing protein [Oceanobacter mangrovi]
MMKRSAKTLLGILLVLGGIVVTPLPIPFGILMIVIGLSLLVTTVPKIRHWLKQLRHKYQQTSAGLNRLKPRLPAFARKLIEDTDPESP